MLKPKATIISRLFQMDLPPGVPPLPATLLVGLLVTRFASGIAQIGLAWSLWMRPPLNSSTASALQRWLANVLRIDLDTLAVILFISGTLSIALYALPRFAQFILWRLVAYLILTFPLIVYIGLVDWFLLIAEPTRSATPVVLYTTLLLLVWASGSISIGLWSWLMLMRVRSWTQS